MINKKLIILFLGLACLCKSQNITVDFNLEQINLEDSNIVVILNFFNQGNEPVTVIKPEIEDLYIYLWFDLVNIETKEEYSFFVNEIPDIDEIIVEKENAVCLFREEGFYKRLKIPREKICPALIKGEYIMSFKYDLQYVNIETDYKHLINGEFETNKVNFEIK
jgi:hypothetical protein